MIEPIKVCELDAGSPKYQVLEVPDNGGDQQRKDHRESCLASDLQNQFDRQQRNDAERHQSGGGHDPEKIPQARPHHRDVRLQRMGVDHGGYGVGRVMKSVDELESQRHQQRNAQQEIRQDRRLWTPVRSDARLDPA